jgi:hypothetical protein
LLYCQVLDADHLVTLDDRAGELVRPVPSPARLNPTQRSDAFSDATRAHRAATVALPLSLQLTNPVGYRLCRSLVLDELGV